MALRPICCNRPLPKLADLRAIAAGEAREKLDISVPSRPRSLVASGGRIRPVAVAPGNICQSRKGNQSEEILMSTEPETGPVGMMLTAFTAAPMAVANNLLEWTKQAQANSEAFGRALQGSITYTLSCQQDLLQFSMTRLQKDIDLRQELAGARDRADMVKIIAEFHRELLEGYVTVVKELADKSLEMLPDSIEPLQERAKATVEELPKVA